MPTPIQSELRSLRHLRNSYVVFQEDAKNYWPNISKKDRILNAKITKILHITHYPK
jgi:hypothetical protein